MTQEELQEQAENYIYNNLNDETKKDLIISLLNDLDISFHYEILKEMLDNLQNIIYFDGYIEEAKEVESFRNKIIEWNDKK